MDIYQSTKVLPYVYMCKEKTSNKFYIGYRYKNRVPSSEDFGKHYFTSNEYVKENFENFDYYIVAEFWDKNDALEFEQNLIKETLSENQINYEKHLKIKGTKYKEKVPYVYVERTCALPGCDKILGPANHGKCCSKSHSGTYSALKRHRKILPKDAGLNKKSIVFRGTAT